MSLFCLHKWEEPEYNEALGLRYGMLYCGKCQRYKLLNRDVPRPDSGFVPETGFSPMRAIVSIALSMVIIGFMVPVLLQMLVPFMAALNNATAQFGPDDTTGSFLSGIVPLVGLLIGLLPVAAIFGVVRYSKEELWSQGGDDEEEPA